MHGAMDLDPIICGNVYVDWEYRKTWDKYVLGEPDHVNASVLLIYCRASPNKGRTV